MPSRPTEFTITYALLNEGVYDLWVEAGGAEINVTFMESLLDHRRLRLGLPDATDDEIIELLVTEHFDRFEANGEDWKKQRPPNKHEQKGERKRQREKRSVRLSKSVAERCNDIKKKKGG